LAAPSPDAPPATSALDRSIRIGARQVICVVTSP
jgi:hypothetical protein